MRLALSGTLSHFIQLELLAILLGLELLQELALLLELRRDLVELGLLLTRMLNHLLDIELPLLLLHQRGGLLRALCPKSTPMLFLHVDLFSGADTCLLLIR